MEFEKGCGFNSHTITSKNMLVCKDTGRVVAVFYSEDDMNAALIASKPVTVKIIELHPMPNDSTWQGTLLGLGDDGVVYENKGSGWTGVLDNKFI